MLKRYQIMLEDWLMNRILSEKNIAEHNTGNNLSISKFISVCVLEHFTGLKYKEDRDYQEFLFFARKKITEQF